MASKRQRRKRRRRASAPGDQTGRSGALSSAPGRQKRPTAPRDQNGALSSAPGRQKRPTSVGRGKSGTPSAPWGSFPLTELVVLVALVLLVAGFFVAPPRGPVMLGAGLVLGSLAGLELAAREHLAGYRSHTLLLGGAVG